MHIRQLRAAMLEQGGRVITVHASNPIPMSTDELGELDVVVLHIFGDDYEQVREARRKYPELPIVMIAPSIESATRGICTELDPAVMIVGPLDGGRLTAALYAAVNGSISP